MKFFYSKDAVLPFYSKKNSTLASFSQKMVDLGPWAFELAFSFSIGFQIFFRPGLGEGGGVSSVIWLPFFKLLI